MKLYFTPGACSMAPHIGLREAGLTFDLEQVDLATKKTKSGADYTKMNAKGYVPALQLDNGEVLDGSAGHPAIYRRPETGQRPCAEGRHDGAISHAGMAQLRHLGVAQGLRRSVQSEDARRLSAGGDRAHRARLDFLAKQLDGKPYLTGDKFTAPDAYLFTVLSWAPHLKISLDKWPTLGAYLGRVGARPQVQAR